MSLVLIGGGGTGGHIYPALAIARALKRIEPGLTIEFVGTERGLEKDLVTREGFKLHFLKVGRLHSSVGRLEQFKTLALLPIAMLQALYLVWRLKPRFVLGVGGYASGPVVLAAALLRKPTFIWEPNAIPGWTNRILARFVCEAMVVFQGAAKMLSSKRVELVGMPVRPEIAALGEGSKKVDHGRELRVLIVGGSQGSRALNSVISRAIIEGQEWSTRFEWVHQTGRSEFPSIQGAYKAAATHVEVQPFIYDMSERLRWADVVISRAGTGAVADMAASGKAVILVPLPTAADDHQTKNAEELAAAGAAILVHQKDFTPGRLRELLTELTEGRDLLKTLEQNIRRFHRIDADVEIAKHLLQGST